MNEVQIFINRLKKIGIELELMGNVPWIYLSKVNGNRYNLRITMPIMVTLSHGIGTRLNWILIPNEYSK
jgi:hypothetical protein